MSPVGDALELVGRVEDVGDALLVGAAHKGVASRRMCSSRGLRPPVRHDVDRAPEQLLQVVLEVEEVEQGTVGVELDEQVDVAGLVVVPAGDRSEDYDRPPPMR